MSKSWASQQGGKQTCADHIQWIILGTKIGNNIYECYGENGMACENIATRRTMGVTLEGDDFVSTVINYCEKHSIIAGEKPIEIVKAELEEHNKRIKEVLIKSRSKKKSWENRRDTYL